MTSQFLNVHEELRHALDRGELVLAYQPIVDLNDGALTGVEALLRWNHPTRGLLWPGDFLGDVEEVEMWSMLGAYVIATAASQARIWRSGMPGRAMSVAINVSAPHLETDDLLAQVAQAQVENELEPGALTLEISERTLFSGIDGIRERIESLEQLGAKILVDDFGTSYARATALEGAEPGGWSAGATDSLLMSLMALEDFAVDVIAIDRCLLERLFAGASDAALVHTVVRLAHRLGFRVLAEAVETASEAEQLRQSGCDLAQGYYFDRPQSAEYIEILVREARDARREQVLRPVPPSLIHQA